MTITVKMRCRNHNDQYRNVKNVYNFKSSDFFEKTGKNVLITGGNRDKRLKALCRCIKTKRQNSQQPIIIFGSGGNIVEKLISFTGDPSFGTLYVTNRTYSGYDPFYGMPKELICGFFSDLALAKGYRDTSSLCSYLMSFLNILKARSDICLENMVSFAANSDSDIAHAAEDTGNVYDCEMLRSSCSGGIAFRSLLDAVLQVMGPISRQPQRNILTQLNAGSVYYIDTSTDDFDTLALYFLHELKAACRVPFSVIFDECILLNNKKFSEYVNVLKQLSGINVTVCHENAAAIPCEGMLNSFQHQLVFLKDSTAMASDLQKVLDGLGKYSHFEPSVTVASQPAVFFSFRRSRNESVISHERPRVLMVQEERNDAVITGIDGSRIIITKNFIFD